MDPTSKVIIRTIVVEFYRQNVAFFGLIVLVFFGFIRGAEHIAIGSFLIANPVSLLFLYGFFLTYIVKIFLFARQALSKAENQFLSDYVLLPALDRSLPVLIAGFLLFLLPLVYSVFLVYLAIANGYVVSIVWLLTADFIFVGFIGFFLYKQLMALPHEHTIVRFKILSRYARPASLFFVEHLIRNEPVLLFLTKAYSCLLIISASMLYQFDEYDLRLFTTAILLAFSGNVAIINKYVWFYYHRLTVTKNLPLSYMRILLYHLAALTVILIPEILVIFRYYPIQMLLVDVSGILLFGAALCQLMFALMIIRHTEMEKLMIWNFWLIVGTTFLILFSIHPLLLGLMALVTSAIIVYKRHYHYEYMD